MRRTLNLGLIWIGVAVGLIILATLLARNDRAGAGASRLDSVSNNPSTSSPPSPPSNQGSNSASGAERNSSARIAEIFRLLDSGADRSTGREFSLGPGGTLAGAPTERVALLDELARLDPQAAAAYSAKILTEFRSPDEWAIALRNYARAMPASESRAFLRAKLAAMWSHEPWRATPSVGFLEAFDVAAHVGGDELLPPLTGMVRLTNRADLAQAAYLALDRMTQQDPLATLTWLQAQPDQMRGREVTRANYFARANVGDPRQRALIETYLLDPARTPAELSTFAGLFPLASYDVKPGLLTTVATPDGATLALHDRQALVVIDQWLTDDRFSRLRPLLTATQSRLRQFTAAAAAGTAR